MAEEEAPAAEENLSPEEQKKAEKEAQKAAKLAEKKEKQEARRKAREAARQRRHKNWNTPLTSDGSYIFIINFLVISGVSVYILLVAAFFIKYK